MPLLLLAIRNPENANQSACSSFVSYVSFCISHSCDNLISNQISILNKWPLPQVYAHPYICLHVGKACFKNKDEFLTKSEFLVFIALTQVSLGILHYRNVIVLKSMYFFKDMKYYKEKSKLNIMEWRRLQDSRHLKEKLRSSFTSNKLQRDCFQPLKYFNTSSHILSL